MSEKLDERSQRPGIIGGNINDEFRFGLHAALPRAIARSHVAAISMDLDKWVLPSRSFRDFDRVIGACVIEYDDREVLDRDRERAINTFESRKQRLRVVVGDDEDRHGAAHR